MAKCDLNSMSVADLDALIAEASALRVETREKRRLALKSEIETKLKAEGFSAFEVLGSKVMRAKAEKLPARYADPADRTSTWSGKGRTPAWLQAHLDKGAKLERFRLPA